MFVPGHAWQAVDLLSRAKGVPDLLILDHHLKAAGNWQSGDYRIYERASEIAEKESQVRMAFGLAKCAAELHPESNIRVADLASILGDRTDRKQALEKALSYFNERLTKDADQTAARLGLAACQQRLDRINDALATLRGSIGLANCDQTQIKGALVELLVQLHNKEVAKLSDYSMADLKKLNEAATHEGSNPKVAEAVAF